LKYKWAYRNFYRKKYILITKKVANKTYKYEDPNRIANISGTPGWKVVQFAKNNGINYIIDLHYGKSVDSSKGLVYATPGWTEEKRWAHYINKAVGSKVGRGNRDPGMVNVYGNKLGINTLTLEVERDTGSTLKWAKVEFKMLKAACRYLFPTLT